MFAETDEALDVPAWEQSKENVQPIKRGRNINDLMSSAAPRSLTASKHSLVTNFAFRCYTQETHVDGVFRCRAYEARIATVAPNSEAAVEAWFE
jgi:hypothetical protein